MYIGLTATQRVAVHSQLSEMSEFLTDMRTKVLEPFTDSGMKVTMSADVVKAMLLITSVVHHTVNDLHNGEVVNLEVRNTAFVEAVSQFMKACSTGVTVE